MSAVYISIGSNIDPAKNIRSALSMLKERFGNLQLSTIYQNPAVGFEGDDFYNLVAGFETEYSIDVLEEELDAIEETHGRKRDQPKFSSRPLDLDLLLYGDHVIIKDGRQKLPRHEITRYAFVLGPLAELIPEQQHPVNGKTYAELWHAFDGGKCLKRVEI